MTTFQLKQTFTPKYIILLLAIWQFFSVLLIALGIWPAWVVWLNLSLSAAYLLWAPVYFGLIFLITNMGFFVALPIRHYDALSMWRVLFALESVVWLLKEARPFSLQSLKAFLKALKNSFFWWDKYLALFGLVGLVSITYAKYPFEGFKQIVSWLNIYFIYILLINVIKTKHQVTEIIKYTAVSLCVIVFLGYVQLIATFFTSTGTFWTYWASYVSKLYYGQALATSFLNSSSWFSGAGKTLELRMFSIMPDPHAFAMIAVYCISFLLPLTYIYRSGRSEKPKPEKQILPGDAYQNEISLLDHDNKVMGYKFTYILWSAIRFAGLAVVLSGTRAIWVGLLLPFGLVGLTYYINFHRDIAKRIFWPLAIIIFFFVLSPLINAGLHYLQVSKFEENFISRAQTIYDLKAVSNIKSLEVWQSAFNYANQHPFGTGPNNFIVTLLPKTAGKNNYKQMAEIRNAPFNLPQSQITAHNLYLQIWIEIGLVGLVAFLLFWWKFFSIFERFMKKYRNENNFLLFFVIEMALTFLWFLASGMFDTAFLNSKILVYFFISLALSGIIMRDYEKFKRE